MPYAMLHESCTLRLNTHTHSIWFILREGEKLFSGRHTFRVKETADWATVHRESTHTHTEFWLPPASYIHTQRFLLAQKLWMVVKRLWKACLKARLGWEISFNVGEVTHAWMQALRTQPWMLSIRLARSSYTHTDLGRGLGSVGRSPSTHTHAYLGKLLFFLFPFFFRARSSLACCYSIFFPKLVCMEELTRKPLTFLCFPFSEKILILSPISPTLILILGEFTNCGFPEFSPIRKFFLQLATPKITCKGGCL